MLLIYHLSSMEKAACAVAKNNAFLFLGYVKVNNTACSFFLVLQKWVLCLR